MAVDRIEISRIAHALADAARAETLPRFRSPGLDADNKAGTGFDPVTEADRAAERAMRAILAQERTDDGILGEEYGPQPGNSGLTWVLDPVDGTRAFMAGIPSWGTLIGVIGADGRPVYGLVDQPWMGERFEGGFGAAQLTGTRGTLALDLRGKGRGLDEAIVMTTFPEFDGPDEAAAFGRVAERCRITRYGLDCYAYALLAAGHVDLVIESGLQPYDIVAPMALIEAAGGIVTAWDGGPAEGGGRVLAAASPALHAAAMELLA